MDVLWAVPPVAMVAGVGLAVVQLRGIAGAAADLQGELRRFSEAQVAVSEVRSAAAMARSAARGRRVA